MQTAVDILISIQASMGDTGFIAVSVLLTIVLCWIAIPKTTDLMVNHAAGLAGRWLGKGSRTLVINASTNNPELFSMGVALGSKRMGGWANPLGSLLANCYLMYAVALVWVAVGYLIRGDRKSLGQLIRLLWAERMLVAWHIVMSITTFAFGFLALKTMYGQLSWFGLASIDEQASGVENMEYPAQGNAMYIALALLVVSVVGFVIVERRLKRKRPNLFSDIDDSDHGHSLFQFALGTVGLIISCFAMNVLFVAWNVLYHDSLTAIFGMAVFAGLHYVVGAIITSLPEMRVATENYRKLTVPDLNTALASASYSNFVNLVICTIGLMIFIGLTWAGYVIPWG